MGIAENANTLELDTEQRWKRTTKTKLICFYMRNISPQRCSFNLFMSWEMFKSKDVCLEDWDSSNPHFTKLCRWLIKQVLKKQNVCDMGAWSHSAQMGWVFDEYLNTIFGKRPFLSKESDTLRSYKVYISLTM